MSTLGVSSPVARWGLGRAGLPALAAVGLSLAAGLDTIVNSDLGWILRFGSDAVAAHAIPATNTQSFTDPGFPIVLHEWAACIGLYLVQASWGAAGLIVLKWILGAATLLVLAAALRQVTTSTAGYVLALLLAAHCLSALAFPLLRPQLVSWLGLAWMVYAGLSGRRWALWSCVPVCLVWSNMHGGVLAGIVLLAVLCGGLLVEGALGKVVLSTSPAEVVAVPAISAATMLVNPYGARLLLHTWHHATDRVRLLNREWMPLWRIDQLRGFEKDALVLMGFVLLLALALLPVWRVRLWSLLAIGILASVSANRHLRMAPILLAPALAASLGYAVERVGWSLRQTIERATLVLSAAAILFFANAWLRHAETGLRLVDQKRMDPGAALWVMRANELTGKVWNDFNWGGLLVWAIPEARVACDGRNVTAYSERVLEECIPFESEPEPVDLLTRYGAEVVLLPAHHPALKKLASRYVPLYCDAIACVLSSRPQDAERARAGLRLPPGEIHASDFFSLPASADAVGTAGLVPR